MVKIPDPRQRTAAAIFRGYEENAEDWRRPHLGASVIGDENCLRHLWYLFRWAQSRNTEGRMLRLFRRGHEEEVKVIGDLRRIDVEVLDVDPNTGQQWSVWLIPGHFGGSCDGKIRGVIEAPKTWHVLEVKGLNDKAFKAVQKAGVREAQPGHFAQMQTYMHAMKLTRAFYVVVNKNTDHIHTERITYDRAFAEALIQKAERVVFANEPLARIKEDPSWFECKNCDHRDICHLDRAEQLERNCRTCASSTPRRDGRWECELHQKILTDDEQREGCASHLFIPQMLPWEWVGYDEDTRSATYRQKDGATIIDQKKELKPWKPE